MSILNLLKSPVSFIRKDIISTVVVRTFCSENAEEVEVIPQIDLKKQKVPEHPIEECLRYMDSDAYKTTYGDKPVWHIYVRNYRGSLPPQTRKSCIYGGVIRTGNPCPICRDSYLRPDYRNIKLLKQFISPYGGNILDTMKTGVCQVQHRNLIVAIRRAQNFGLLTFSVPHRHFDYALYNK